MGYRNFLRTLRFDATNVSLLKHRYADLHLVSMHQSGTHWLTHMLTSALCEQFHVPEPEHIRDRSVIRRPQNPQVYPQLPQILNSHDIPGGLVHCGLARRMYTFPRYVVLVRDIRAMLVSLYEKKKHLPEFADNFSDFIRDDALFGKHNPINLWRRVRFLNAWHRDRQRLGADRVHVVRYEELKDHPAERLQSLWQFAALPDRESAFFQHAVDSSTKDKMAKKEDPHGQFRLVRDARRHPFEWFNPADRAFLTDICQRDLDNWYGYDYSDWSIPVEDSVKPDALPPALPNQSAVAAAG